MLQRAARNAYSWWWASHVRTKQSKWLDQNLQDMEEKVEYILKIIDDDGDTFRQRAEMYYRKRPEIVNFVEDAFRGYRALAERYDHLSKELQSANRAIAAIYPERISFGMDDNDDFDMEKIPAMGLPLDELNTLSKNPPAPPKINIPKTNNVLRKNPNAPTRMMSKKGLLKINPDDDDADHHHHAPVSVACSGLNKSQALERIDKLQKEILTLQTEKEFLRSAYESRAEKYWQIEKQITEMQGEVNDLQDEFGIGMVIGDDDARTLMTTSAMKSCQETLAHLQHKQKQAAEDARIEFQKVQEAREKFERLKEKLNYNQGDQDLDLVKNSEQTKLEQEEGPAEEAVHDLDTLQRKIREESQAGSGNSVTISDLAEQVDELVDKVISLGNVVSSQNAYVKRLRSETNDLHGHIKSLEGEKEMLIDDSSSKSHKIKELEQELQRVQSLNQCIKEQNNNLQTQLVEASCSLDDLSEKLLHAEPDEEEENVTLSSHNIDVLGVTPVKQIQLQEVKVTEKSVPKDFKDLNNEEAEEKAQDMEKNSRNIGKQKNLTQTISSYPETHKLITSSGTNRELGAQGMMNGMITPDQSLEADIRNSSISEMDNEKNPFLSSQLVNINDFNTSPARTTPEYSSSSGWERDVILSNNGKDLVYERGKHPSEAGSSNALTGGLKEQQNVTSSFDFTERGKTAEAPIDDSFWYYSNTGNQKDIYSSVGDLLDVNPKMSDRRRDSIIPIKSMELKYEENKGEISGVYASVSAEEKRHSGPGQSVHDGLERVSDQCWSSPEVVEMADELKKSGKHTADKLGDKNYSRWKEDLSGERGIDKKTGIKEDNINLNPGNPNGSSKKSSIQPKHDLPVTARMRSTSEKNQQKDGFNENVNVANPDIEWNLKQNSHTDQGNDEEAKRQNLLPTNPSNDNEDEVGEEEDDQPNWRELFLSGIDDKEKILLNEYTSVLRNYKEARKKLNEVEKKKRASLFQYCIQIKVLKSANAEKESEIQLLREQLNFVQADQTKEETVSVESTEGTTMATSLCVSDDQPANGEKEEKGLRDLSGKETSESKHDAAEEPAIDQASVSLVEGHQDVKIVKVGDSRKFSIIEEKIRTDIDELLEENIGLWMRFSTTFHQIQKFQTTVKDLQEEIAKLKGKNQKGGSTDHHNQSLSSDIRPIYRHLTEIQTELALWLDHNSVIKDDLENRSSSLSSIQEEILRLSSAAGSKEERVTGLDDYQAAKFQGELLNMKQENKKVADELKSGLERVKNLQVEIEKTLKQIDDEFEVSVKRHHSRYAAVRSRIPLKSFLFGVKLKKQKRPSFFACISPSLQKQQSDTTVSPM